MADRERSILVDKRSRNWQQRYAARHRLERVRTFAGIRSPDKVRVYHRHSHYVLQWWEPSQRQTCSLRVEGDLLDALAKAREVDDRLVLYRTSGQAAARIDHDTLIQRFVEDLSARTEAGTLATTSASRYRAALSHYGAFVANALPAARYRMAHAVDREFALRFAAWLTGRSVARNGRAGARQQPMVNRTMVLAVVRAMFEWAQDSQRGNVFPAGFVSPFRRGMLDLRSPPRDPLGEPDITVPMAAELIRIADQHQRRLFLPIILWGLRPSELRLAFTPAVGQSLLRIGCIPELDYTTKGVRDKALPIISPLRSLLLSNANPGRLLFVRRSVAAGIEHPPLSERSRDQIVCEYRRQISELRNPKVIERERARDRVINDAGGITYDELQSEFQSLAQQLNWPREATLKDLRHLCQTCLDNAGLSRETRQYLLGHSPGRAAITAYVHLNRLSEMFTRAIKQELQPVLDAAGLEW